MKRSNVFFGDFWGRIPHKFAMCPEVVDVDTIRITAVKLPRPTESKVVVTKIGNKMESDVESVSFTFRQRTIKPLIYIYLQIPFQNIKCD
ncbi:hypothetical protein CEXT_100861 [Caerostris extrusa]|uniref:SHSP domain-containing protein n=1 Tax=Caerostris extrusa TaxID=172846 RepID=A0AAV4MEB9_CAEEX|nr:hypothetical protein CEXT_100861 [Caerostris extrusa]